ncbi:MAG: TRAP transporter small permease [Deltaproteobacteria bacterium]|nr:TRAP transporter small permease [Deltaproteobacteria bacterium]MBW1959175.1 TRAP transporter small permease [Deltaproteobacteria bacterium]
MLHKISGKMSCLNEIGAILSGIALCAMMAIGALDVLFGKFFNMPIPGTFEATEALMVLSAFLAFAFNQQVKGHIQVELIISRLPKRIKLKFDSFNYLMSALFFFLVAWQGWVGGWHSLMVREYESGLIAFPVYPAKLILALGASMMVLQCLVDFANALSGRNKHTHPEELESGSKK